MQQNFLYKKQRKKPYRAYSPGSLFRCLFLILNPIEKLRFKADNRAYLRQSSPAQIRLLRSSQVLLLSFW